MADLVIEFKKVDLPDTIDFGDEGKVEVKVTNVGDTRAQGPITIDLWSSVDNNIESNDVLLASKIKNINLQPGNSRTFTIEYDNITSAISPGAYNLIAQVDSANNIPEINENNNITSQLVSAPGTDVVIDWISTALNAIQQEGEAGRGAFGPTRGTRALAILSTAVYDAVNSFEKGFTPYAVDVNAPTGASIEAAAVGAAHRALSLLLPGQQAMFDTQLVKSLAEIQDSMLSEMTGITFGASIADQIFNLRANDGSDNNTPYTPPAGDYVWQPDPPNFTAVTPNWGGVTPWAITSVEDFSPDGLDGTPTGDTERYIREIEEVRLFGGRENTDVTTLLRTPDQTDIAFFWANDRIDTFRPNGQLVNIAAEVATREGNSLIENARLFAALNVALADVAITAWANKYEFVQPRPNDVIAGGIAANDGFEETVADPNWQSLLPTPAFPDYISGHTTLGGGFAGVMTNFFGDNYSFETGSQDLLGKTRSFSSFIEAGIEDGLSRIYGGVHVREATVDDAFPTGLAIGDFVSTNFFQPIV